MDQKLQNLRRLQNTDSLTKDRYIRELERLVGLDADSPESRMKCLTRNCPNHANEGYGIFIMTQANVPGQPPDIWDEAVGPLFVCGPCYRHLCSWRD